MAGCVAEVSVERLKLQAFLEKQVPGASLTYTEIETATDIRMDQAGRDLLARACEASRIPRRAMRKPARGLGIVLAGPENAADFAQERAEAQRRAAKRAQMECVIMLSKHGAKMAREVRQHVLASHAFQGALLSVSEQHRALVATKQKPNSVSIPLEFLGLPGPDVTATLEETAPPTRDKDATPTP